MNLLDRIRLTLHCAVEIVCERASGEPVSHRLPDTLLLKRPSDSTLRQMRNLRAT